MVVIGSSMESTEEFSLLETAKRQFGSFTLRHEGAGIGLIGPIGLVGSSEYFLSLEEADS